ncbi:sigma-70 family RNA polymerase sigma factor [Segetibacter aerophilus]|uniref:ECF-family RNA polymerase sigma factor n=1 Tax=Segetibacter aerophilus TaxID=670293 RepID=A0A512BJW1_9BACT|nr:sigma-70 family RNA polymerase sigma factor [Segetibacter aerophilus]GEO12252.1 ECF-family RNA polymerase sigma factor [Segetibacter aerophilus]
MATITALQQFTDVDVIERVVRGEISLYEVLIRRYNPYLYKVGRSYGFRHEDVEDLMQETFINAYQNLAKFENKAAFKTWLIRIMLNQCYHKAQKQSSFREIAAEIFIDKNIPMFSKSHSSDVETTIANRELRSLIEKAIIKMPVDYRMVFSLREVNGLSVHETAHTLNITESNVKVRLNRAKAMLRKELEKMYSPEEIFQFNLIYCDKIVSNVLLRITSI